MVNSKFLWNSIFIIIFLTLSVYWAVMFLRKIFCCRKYKRAVARCISDDESRYLNEQFKYHYETEIRKYALLVMINLSENISCIFFYAASNFFLPSFQSTQLENSMINSSFISCTSSNTTVLYGIVKSRYVLQPYQNGLSAVGGSAELFVPAFCVCLMDYLIIRIKQIKHSTNKILSPSKLLILTASLSAVIVITGFIQFTVVLSCLLFDITAIIYFCIFINTAKRLKCALLQRALERLIQHGSNQEEMRQYTYFKCTINIISCAFLALLLSEVLAHILQIIIFALFFGQCYFPFNLFPALRDVIQSEEGADKIHQISHFLYLTHTVLYCLGVGLVLSQISVVTIAKFVNKFRNCIRGKKNIKYTTVNSSLEVSFIAN